MSEATQTQPEGPFAATPREELERQIMCPTVPKTEREWWAADEIARLRAALREIESITVHSGGDIHGVHPSFWEVAFKQAQDTARAALGDRKEVDWGIPAGKEEW